MNCYPSQAMSLTDLLKRTIRLHYIGLRYSIFSVAFITVIKYLAIVFLTLYVNVYAQATTYLLSILCMVYFFALALWLTHQAFLDRPTPVSDGIKTITQHLFKIYITFLFYAVGAVAVFYAADLLGDLLHRLLQNYLPTGSVSLIITAALLLIYVAMFVFSMPLTIIDNKPFQKAFYESIFLTEKNRMGIFILYLIMFSVILLLTPGTLHEYFLSMYHLNVIFDFIVLSVGMPLFINLLLLMINNGKVQVVLN